jgi:hypothetical protein
MWSYALRRNEQMKDLQSLITILIVFLLMVLIVPGEIALLLFFPIYFIGILCFSITYNIRVFSKPKLKEINQYKFAKKIKELDKQYDYLLPMQFYKYDEFTISTYPPILYHMYKKLNEPIFLSISHIGNRITFEYQTFFENGVVVNTCRNKLSGLIPLDKNYYIQIFENYNYEQLLKEHMKGIEYIKAQGINPIDIPGQIFREYFIKDISNNANKMRKLSFWQLKFLYWSINKKDNSKCKSIETQHIPEFKMLSGVKAR